MFVPMGKFWAVENRSVTVRVPQLTDKDKRVEHRVAGADANPYFAAAAILGGMLHGLRTKADPGEEATGNASLEWEEGMPKTFLEGLENHQATKTLRGILGEQIWDTYLGVKREELNWYLKERTAAEARWYVNSVG